MKPKWLIYGALAGLAAWLLWWRKGPAGLAVTVTLPEIFEAGGPFGAWTQITNNSQEVKAVTAVASGDAEGIVLSFNPTSILFTLDPGQTLTDYFWFSVPDGTAGLTGQVRVDVDGISTTTSFVVEVMP